MEGMSDDPTRPTATDGPTPNPASNPSANQSAEAGPATPGELGAPAPADPFGGLSIDFGGGPADRKSVV